MNRISVTLRALGISAGLSGYRYLRKAIEITMAKGDNPVSIMGLYDLVAEEYGSTRSSVERACRYAIHECWGLKDPVYIKETNTFSNVTNVPTTGRFIRSVADYLLTH